MSIKTYLAEETVSGDVETNTAGLGNVVTRNLRQRERRRNPRFNIGDTVTIPSGKYKGKKGKIVSLSGGVATVDVDGTTLTFSCNEL